MSIAIRVEGITGATIRPVLRDCKRLARVTGCWVVININTIEGMIGAHDDTDMLHLRYKRALETCAKAFTVQFPKFEDGK